nr:hypothetical protein [Tanacetum cinerariifolium]
MLSFNHLIKSGLVMPCINADILRHSGAPFTCTLLALKQSMNASVDYLPFSLCVSSSAVFAFRESDPPRRGRCFVVSLVSCIPFLFNLHLHVIGASNIASDETSGLLPPLVKVSSSLACAGLFACTGMLSAWKGLEVSSIRRIQGIGYDVLEFLGVRTTFDIFQDIHILYLEYDVLSFTGYGVLDSFLCGLWGSTFSNTPLSYNSFVAHRDNFIHHRLWVLKAHERKSQAFKKFCGEISGYGEKSTCYIRDLKGNDLLTCSCGAYIYSVTLQDTSTPSPICLMAKATSLQAWLCHHGSHLNFDTINLFLKYDIVTGLPKLKFVNDHLYSSCELGKAKLLRKKYRLSPKNDMPPRDK